MVSEGALETFAGRRRVEQNVEKCLAVLFREGERFVRGDGFARGFRQSRSAEIGQFAALKLCGSFNERLGLCIDAEPKTFFTRDNGFA
jgi:hypothetical protein